MTLLIDNAKAERLRKAADQGPFHCGGIADPQSSCPTTWIYGPAAPGMQSGRQVASQVPTDVAPLFEASADLLTDRRTLLARIGELEDRLRTTAQTLVKCVGADGPANAEEMATRAVARIEELDTKCLDLIADVDRLEFFREERNEQIAQLKSELDAMRKQQAGGTE